MERTDLQGALCVKKSVQQQKKEENSEFLFVILFWFFSTCFVDFTYSHAGVETNSDESIVRELLREEFLFLFVVVVVQVVVLQKRCEI